MTKIRAYDSCFAIIVSFSVLEEYRENFRKAIIDNAADSLRLEPGCRLFDVCEEQAGAFVLYELYDNEAAFTEHLNMRHFLEFDALSKPWVTAKSVKRATRLQNAEMDFGL